MADSNVYAERNRLRKAFTLAAYVVSPAITLDNLEETLTDEHLIATAAAHGMKHAPGPETCEIVRAHIRSMLQYPLGRNGGFIPVG